VADGFGSSLHGLLALQTPESLARIIYQKSNLELDYMFSLNLKINKKRRLLLGLFAGFRAWV
jgi:hypothetical protein